MVKVYFYLIFCHLNSILFLKLVKTVALAIGLVNQLLTTD